MNVFDKVNHVTNTFFYRYMKYLYPYECDKKNLSTPSELQAAIDGNRREGRRSSYGQYENQMQNQLSLVSLYLYNTLLVLILAQRSELKLSVMISY